MACGPKAPCRISLYESCCSSSAFSKANDNVCLCHTLGVECLTTLSVRQGSAEGRVLQDAAGRSYGVALVSRRSRLHPGMRYIARGLNALASPGNEAEVEQLLWTLPTGGLGLF